MGSFAQRLRDAMQSAGLKAVDLHERTGISKASISEYLSGNYEPKQKNVYRLAEALHVAPSYLMGLSEHDPAPAPPAPQKSDGLPELNARDERDRTANGGPVHASAREMHQLEKILAEPNLTYNGVALGAEDIEKINRALELAFWDAKEKNKRKK